MKKKVFTLLLIFLFVISIVNGFDIKEDSLLDVTGSAVKDGNFFSGIIDFFRGLFGLEPVGIKGEGGGVDGELISYWNFDDVCGSTIVVGSVGTFNGNLYGDVNLIPGYLGRGLELDGDGDYVGFGNSDNLNIGTGDFTVMVWVKVLANSKSVILGKKSGISNNDKGYSLFIDGGNFLWKVPDGTNNLQVSYPVFVDQWIHLAGVRSGDEIELFVNGNSEGTDSGLSGVDITNLDIFYIGIADIGTENFFEGLIDEVKIYDYALIDIEIENEMGSLNPAVEICDNGVDDDCDGDVDCADYDCNGLPGNPNDENDFCEFGYENTCDDEFDNDADILFDCNDLDCADDEVCGGSPPGCIEGETLVCSTGLLGICEIGIETCENGIYGACIENISVGSQTEICNDELDNDCDSLTDCDDVESCFEDIACVYCECSSSYLNNCDLGEICQESSIAGECTGYNFEGETPFYLNGLCISGDCNCNSDAGCDTGFICNLTTGCSGDFLGLCVEDLTPPASVLSTSPSSLNFGSTGVANPVYKILNIYNNGNLPLVITSVISDNNSVSLITELPLTFPNDLNFSFNPEGEGSYSGEILIETQNDEQFITVTYTGTGLQEDCTDGSDNDGDGDIDCDDDNCYSSPIVYYEYFDSENVLKWDCSGGKKTEKDWTDGIDNDGDGVKDKLDSDCTGNSCNNLDLTGVETSGGLEFYQYSYIDEVDCSYTLTLTDEADDTSIENCLNLTIGEENNCGQATIGTSNVAEFYNCYVGDTISSVTNTVNIECSVLEKCNSNSNYDSLELNILEYNICSGELNVGEENLDAFILLEPNDGEDIEMNETFDIKINIKNGGGEEKDFKAKAQLIEMGPMTSEVTESSDVLTLSNLADDDFEFEMTLPGDLDIDKDYRLYYKVYESGEEASFCVSDSVLINVLEMGCPDSDEDDYEDEVCGGSDCDDTDEDVNPGATEICNDFIDNDCNGLTDNADSSCQDGDGELDCTSSWNCGGWSPDPCSGGQSQTRICTDLNNCGILLNKPSESRTCPSAGTPDYGSEDTDLDGLPDEWEYSYFGNLAQGPNDDFDGDGYTNSQEYSTGGNPLSSDIVKSSSGLTTTLLIALGVLVIAGLAIFIYFKIGKNKKVQGSSNLSALTNYVKKSRAAGVNDDEIKQKLLAAGWKKKDIDNVL